MILMSIIKVRIFTKGERKTQRHYNPCVFFCVLTYHSLTFLFAFWRHFGKLMLHTETELPHIIAIHNLVKIHIELLLIHVFFDMSPLVILYLQLVAQSVAEHHRLPILYAENLSPQ